MTDGLPSQPDADPAGPDAAQDPSETAVGLRFWLDLLGSFFEVLCWWA